MANTLKFGNGEWYGKKDTILAYNDENSNYKPLPFDFSRASKATVINKDGLIEVVGSGQPRIDYKDNTKGALLLEPSRSNLITYSEDFNQSAWNFKSNINIQSGMLSPKGDLNAYKITATSTGNGYIGGFLNQSTGKYKSIWARTVSGTGKVNLLNVRTEGSTNGLFNLSEEWTRFEILHNGVDIFYGVDFRNSLSTLNEIIIYGAQLEQGSYATSYIPTSGSAVTRLQDDFTCNLPDSDSFNSSSGFSVITKFGIGQTNGSTSVPFFQFSDDTSSTYIGFGSNQNNFRCRLNLSGTSYLNTQNAPRTQENNLFISCDSNGWSQGANGSVGNTGTNDASVFDRLSYITINVIETYGIIKIREILIYNTRLSNSELAALTQV